ncbi:hypothetical protein BH10PSE12_BH10PSE12_08230 [soil metagenome]
MAVARDASIKLRAIAPALIEPLADTLAAPSAFNATLKAHGLYSTTQFVLRLSPRVHELVDAITNGSTDSYDPDELYTAYSTYLHETIHWWQHVGSTAGLILSLCYPAQCVANIEQLRDVIRLIGPKKSLRTWAENALRAGMDASDFGLIQANRAVNNTIDTEFYKLLTVTPLRAPQLFEDRYFESVGHSYAIAYANTLHALIGSCDFAPNALPDPESWNGSLDRLRDARHEGFYRGSPIRRARVGLLDLFEGQARFNQLQFLHRVGGPVACTHYRDAGYCEGVYISAFDEFRRLTGFDWPTQIDDPLIALFLLICDIAINPTRGFPFPLNSLEDMIIDVDPGARFTRLCDSARTNPDLASAIRSQSVEEYVEVATALVHPCGYDHPMAALEAILNLIDEDGGAARLMREWESFAFTAANQPIRVMVSHFLAYCRDKYEHPEFFCWPGAHAAGVVAMSKYSGPFMRNLSLFSDRMDNDGIFPRAIPGRDRAAIQETLNIFFGSTLLYDLTRQWILEDGPFRYDFHWLTGRHDNDALIAWAKTLFETTFGAHPDSFELVSNTAD